MKVLSILSVLLFCSFSYAEDYWGWWHAEASSILKCSSHERNAKFMQKALDNLGNVEKSEANADVLEKLAVDHLECLKNSAFFSHYLSQ